MRFTRWGFRLLKRVLPSLLIASSTLHAAPTSDKTASVAAEPAAESRKASQPDVRSTAVLVVDTENSSVLFARQSRKAVPIASITKLMTALVLLEGDQALDEPVTITPADRDIEKRTGSRLVVGATLSRGDLLHIALMSSDNRAAHAVARRYPGGVPAMVAAMNRKARSLGMKSARFADPSGLSSRNVASPQDLAILVQEAARNPTIAKFSTDDEHTVDVGRGKLEFHNTNTLVNKPDWNILVQKTGYTNEAGRCLVMQAVIEGRSVVMVLMSSFGKYTRVADARRIRRWLEAHQA
jgi:D-alanyl-D-alanine endopeptidase (penicillin-binding protein 7)